MISLKSMLLCSSSLLLSQAGSQLSRRLETPAAAATNSCPHRQPPSQQLPELRQQRLNLQRTRLHRTTWEASLGHLLLKVLPLPTSRTTLPTLTLQSFLQLTPQRVRKRTYSSGWMIGTMFLELGRSHTRAVHGNTHVTCTV